MPPCTGRNQSNLLLHSKQLEVFCFVHILNIHFSTCFSGPSILWPKLLPWSDPSLQERHGLAKLKGPPLIKTAQPSCPWPFPYAISSGWNFLFHHPTYQKLVLLLTYASCHIFPNVYSGWPLFVTPWQFIGICHVSYFIFPVLFYPFLSIL